MQIQEHINIATTKFLNVQNGDESSTASQYQNKSII